ncbi:MAG: c-type cytochrome [Candidatus Binatia bacterium]
MRWGVLAALCGLGAAAVSAVAPPSASLRFVRSGAPERVVTLDELQAHCAVQTVVVDPDPYYQRRKTYRACPLADVLTFGFATTLEALRGEQFLLRALDGYAKPASGAVLTEPGGYLAFADAEHAGWEPIDRKQLDPGPFYVVWTVPGADGERYPWPYQLSTIEITSVAQAFPHTVPRGVAPGSPAQIGSDIFSHQCIACHAINGEGGHVGPDLNIPQSIVEYRPAAQIKAYIRDPATFRYTSMPPHPGLDDAQLEALVAYFTAMRAQKHDPNRPEPAP